MGRLELLFYKKLDSTQKKARELSKTKNNFIIISGQQSRGKGRFDRAWESKKGGLYYTICLEEKTPQRIKYITFVAAISIVKALGKLKIKSSIKWPNDVLIKEKKVCGILTETVLGGKNIALIGIGLNVNQKKFPSMERTPTSLFLEARKEFDIKKVLGYFLDYFESYYRLYEEKDFEKIRTLWKMHAHTLGKEVTIKTLKGKITGKAIDIDEECNLIVKTKIGSTTIIEGDIFTEMRF